MKPPMGVVPLFYCYTARQLAAQCTVIGPVCVCVCVCGGRVGGVCYHDNSKLRASIFTKCSIGAGSDHLQLIKFWRSCAPGKGICGGAKIFGAQCLRLSERFFSFTLCPAMPANPGDPNQLPQNIFQCNTVASFFILFGNMVLDWTGPTGEEFGGRSDNVVGKYD